MTHNYPLDRTACAAAGETYGPFSLPIPNFTRPLPVRRSFPKPLSPAPHFAYNPHGRQASGSVRPVSLGGPASAVVGLFSGRPAG